MKPRLFLLIGSVGVNVVLLAAFTVRPGFAPPALRNYFQSKAVTEERAITERIQSALAAKRAQEKQAQRAAATQAQFWSALQPDDLPGLVARLRAAGFPPTIIRSVVSAQLQTRFAARMDELVASVVDIPYWQPALNNSFTNPKFYEEQSQIYRERSRLLRELMGDDFFASAGSDPTAAQRRRFGDLPKAKISLVQQIEEDYAELASQARAATGGIILPEDREKLALLDREKHADLAALLSPQEVEDYEMRSSAVTSRLRPALTLMDATESEFRAIFQVQQQYNDRINPAGGVSNGEMMQRRRDATQEMNDRLKVALGEARATEFLRASNYEFQSLAQIAQRENLPLAAAASAFDLRTTTSQESMRVYDDKTLTYEQKLAALKTLAENTRAQIVATLGPKAGGAYGKSATWLGAIEGGRAVKFEGPNTSYMSIQRPPSPSPGK
jgi:hypothetical protein